MNSINLRSIDKKADFEVIIRLSVLGQTTFFISPCRSLYIAHNNTIKNGSDIFDVFNLEYPI